LDVETAYNSVAAKPEPPVQSPPPRSPSALGWTVLLLAMSWGLFYWLHRALPYIRNGSDVVFNAKLQWEHKGQVFPADPHVTRVLIFGNSKILAGFLPAWFDHLSSQNRWQIASFNSGFPGSDLFLPPLEALCARGQAPNVLLLTLPWNPDPPRRGIFHFIADDHAVADFLFPFRNFLRDLTAFLLAAPSHGGVLHYYRESQEYERAVIAERGYHLITEQSHFPGGHLPDDFHLASDQPAHILPRVEPAQSAQAGRLNQLIRQYHIACYYVPFYLRDGEAAPPAASDEAFAAQVEQATSCKVLGPDYYLYPNRLFADQTHLNETGAQVYTQALFALLKDKLHALQ
jgi:hypothetical protein